MSSNRIQLLALVALSSAALLCFAGCDAVGVVADKIGGQPDVPAQYEPDKLSPLLVICENFRDPTMSRGDSDRLAKLVNDVLVKKQVGTIIEPDRVALVRDAHPTDFATMNVVDIAREAGAKQVVYIDFNSIGVGAQTGSDLLKGVAAANVSVIDVDAGRAVFPGVSGGLPISYASQMRRAGDHVTLASVRNETLVGLSSRIARLFYKWKPDDNDANIDTGL